MRGSDNVKPEKRNDLKAFFLNHFLRVDYKELRERKKQANESMSVYITAIQAIFHDLDSKMSSEQVISFILEGLDEEIAVQIQKFDPQNIKDFIRIAPNVEQGRKRLT
jgi:hypothetical protein